MSLLASKPGAVTANRLFSRTLTIRRAAAVARWLPSDLHFWLKAIVLALVAIQLANLFWVIAAPVGRFGEWRPAPPRVLSAEAQTVVLAAVDPFFRASGLQATQTAAAAPATDLQLFGTLASQGSSPGSAILGAGENEQKSFAVGEEVAPGVKLVAVHFDRVVLDRGGTAQTIYMPGSEEATDTGPQAGSALATAVGNAFQLKPRNQGGRVSGVLVSAGANQQLFAASGFRTGDVITAVNGAQITSLVDVQQLQSSIAPGARLLLTVERGAQKVPIALNLPSN